MRQVGFFEAIARANSHFRYWKCRRDLGRPFAACYWDTPEGRVFSLRSSDEGADVSEVAKQYGGGGHRNAAGFRVSFATAQAFEV